MDSQHEYIFSRDAAASARLNLQHYLWVASTGHLLHPSIPIPANAVIADIGTGTGIFSLSLSPTLPADARIEASDISLAQCPPKAWWPSNVSFAELDVLSPVPPELHNRFDIIHIRLFMCVVPANDPTPLLANLLRLLKPGGYLQWQESDATTDRVLLADPATPAPRLEQLMDLTHGRSAAGSSGDKGAKDDINAHGRYAWIRTLHERFPAYGGEVVEVVRTRAAGPAQRLVKQDVTFMAVREWAGTMMDKDAGSARQLLALGAGAEEECWASQRGAVVESEMVTWVVRKAGTM